MQERRIDFQLFGQEFSFYSDAPDEEIQQVIALLKEEFTSQGKADTKTLPSTRLLVFGCLRLFRQKWLFNQRHGTSDRSFSR